MRHLYAVFYLFLIGFIQNAQAQGLPGYVISAAGDTLRGTVEETQRQQVLLYTPNSKTPQVFRAAQIRGYGLQTQPLIESRMVRQASGADSIQFVVAQQPGSAALYAYPNDSGLLLRPAASDTLYTLTETNWHVLFNRYLSACPKLQQTDAQILALPFTEANIRKVLAQYNRCIDPQWKPGFYHSRAAWQQSLALYVGNLGTIMPATANGRYRGGAIVNQLGIEWLGVRANGVQGAVQLEYTAFLSRSAPYTTTNYQGTATEEQEIERVKLITLTVTAGKRFFLSRHLSVFVGGGLGPDFGFRSETEIQQRPLGSPSSFATVYTRKNPGGLIQHADAQAGMVVALAGHHQIRLLALYRRYLSDPGLGLPGLQLGYAWYVK